jgi:hypothetical protein
MSHTQAEASFCTSKDGVSQDLCPQGLSMHQEIIVFLLLLVRPPQR